MHKGNEEEEEEEGSLTHSPRAKARRGRGKEGKQPRIALSFLLASYVQRRRRRRRRKAPSSGGINLSPFCLPPPVMAPPRYHNIHQSDRPYRPTDGRKGQGGGGGGRGTGCLLISALQNNNRGRRKEGGNGTSPLLLGNTLLGESPPSFISQGLTIFLGRNGGGLAPSFSSQRWSGPSAATGDNVCDLCPHFHTREREGDGEKRRRLFSGTSGSHPPAGPSSCYGTYLRTT